MTRRPLPRHALLAAACLIAGIAVGRLLPSDGQALKGAVTTAPLGRAGARQVFSPDIRRDPHVVGEQRKLLAMIERQCRTTGEHCVEARSLRRSIEGD